MARLDINSLTLWITAAAAQHPHDLADHVAQRTGVTRRTANKALQRLVDLQWLQRDGTARQPRHRAGLLRQVVHSYPLAGLEEDIPWQRDFAPHFSLPAPVRRMTQHAFCELLNNAIDHSEGTSVTVSLRQTPAHVQLLVSDDGRGVFDKINEAFALGDPTLAMLELSKGKLTSQPQRHTGRGLFFTSKLADVFDLHANEVAFQRREWDADGWSPGRAMKRQGTSVYAAIALDTTRSLDSVLNAYSADGAGFGFERTVVPLRLITSTLAGLESRAQARRVASRLHQFRRAEVDFNGVPHIGHGFADELFRVLAGTPATAELVPINMSPAVAAMVDSVRSG
ncbi:ATP-binding protein [Piscinibacter sp.]|uniref:ATP-binding protein n=1 Tax=Piscinibacter sp. TaxID=1903157 RepID=UPI003559A427